MIPIALIVLTLSVTCIPLDTGVLVMFILGTAMLIMGMSFFTVGSTISEVKKEFGITSSANGILLAIPTEKAYKI